MPSILRVSAPAARGGRAAELAFLYAHDNDSFNRWDASQTLLTEVILDLAERSSRREELVMDLAVVDAVRNAELARRLPRRAISVPGLSVLSQARP